jgi:hypothetical protein
MGQLFEFRDYHYKLDGWEEYQVWATDAMNILSHTHGDRLASGCPFRGGRHQHDLCVWSGVFQ